MAAASVASTSSGGNPFMDPPRYLPAGGEDAPDLQLRTREIAEVADLGLAWHRAQAVLDTGTLIQGLGFRFWGIHAASWVLSVLFHPSQPPLLLLLTFPLPFLRQDYTSAKGEKDKHCLNLAYSDPQQL